MFIKAFWKGFGSKKLMPNCLKIKGGQTRSKDQRFTLYCDYALKRPLMKKKFTSRQGYRKRYLKNNFGLKKTYFLVHPN